ncbi:Sec-independent protein translocase protein TatB [Pelagibacterium halotolerans]|uniref:Sec-independent protein translocase protein TatB n=1 Tax=Pelagibacterium halotolerans TaxID=531813 RepID=UPI00384E8DD5
MLGLGWSEMLVLAAVVLIVVGPKDLPVMLRNLGRMMGTVRRMSNEFRREIDKAIALDEVKEAKRSITEPLRQTSQDINREFNAIRDGKVEPTGKLKPSEPGKESVADEIRARAGMTPVEQEANGADGGESSIKTKAATPSARVTAAARAEAKANESASASGSKPAKSTGKAKPSAAGATNTKASATKSGKAKSKPTASGGDGPPKSGTKATRATPKRTASPRRATRAKKAETGAAADSGEN